ncbi:MAG: hypothetical protein HQL90_04100 [Magnetococcales bacterium]|nr:hypothetical protein [Magnetococcales bacterium]
MNDLMQQSFGESDVGQSTKIEQSGRIAEVQGAIIVAQKCPRNERAAVSRIMDACSRRSLADNAFFSFPKSGKTVSGASIHLMTEIARCWGNIQHGHAELSRDDVKGQSEAVAYAWDMQSNVRAETRFIVVHEISTKNGTKKLTDPRDIYELIANQGSRRTRSCIAKVIPSDIIFAAEERCRETLRVGDGKPLDQRISECLSAFASIGVTRDMVKHHLDGANPEMMTIETLTELGILFKTIKRGERTADEIFGVGLNGEPSGLAAIRAKNAATQHQAESADSKENTKPEPKQEKAAEPPSAKIEKNNVLEGVEIGDIVKVSGTGQDGMPYTVSGRLMEANDVSIRVIAADTSDGRHFDGFGRPMSIERIIVITVIEKAGTQPQQQRSME